MVRELFSTIMFTTLKLKGAIFTSLLVNIEVQRRVKGSLRGPLASN